MRIKLILSKNTEPVDFNYKKQVTVMFHKWVGRNNVHNKISLYSISDLKRAKASKNHLDFPNGSVMCISAHDKNIIKKIIDSLSEDNTFICGMMVSEVIIIDTPHFVHQEVFLLDSPVLIRRYEENKNIYYTYSDEKAGKHLADTLRRKLDVAGMDYGDFTIEFDKSYLKARTKLISYDGIFNIVSICPVIIKGDNRVKRFAWNVGLGNSTGIGFGALK